MDEAGLWQAKAVASAVDLEEQPPAVDPSEAQPWCNFVVWMPSELPAGCTIGHGTLRKEAPPGRVEGVTVGRSPWSTVNPAAYRYEIAGPGRRLRVKQFLYDWAFPALDHPCLWESRTSAVPLGASILWLGTDYMGNSAASARLARTTIELSVLDGKFSDEEVTAVYESMRPAAPDAVAAIAGTPFALLSYWARYPEATMIHVPVGLWKFRRTGRVYTGRWLSDPADIEALLTEYRLPQEVGGLPLDSAARFLDSKGKAEAELVYAGGPMRGHELRVIIQHSGAGHITCPAESEDHPHLARPVDIGVPAALAWTDEQFGPWDATWSDPDAGLEAKLMSSTGTMLGREWFLAAAAEMVDSARTARPASPLGRQPADEEPSR